MASLPVAVVLALASAHAPQVASETIVAFAQHESGLDPLAIHDNLTNRRWSPRSLDGAVTLAYRLMRDGADLDLGLLQIHQANLERLGLTISSAFNPVASIKAGAKVMADSYRSCIQRLAGEAALKCMASSYNTGNATDGFANGYVAGLWRVADQLVPAIRDARQHELPLRSPRAPSDADDLHDAVSVHRVPAPETKDHQ